MQTVIQVTVKHDDSVKPYEIWREVDLVLNGSVSEDDEVSYNTTFSGSYTDAELANDFGLGNLLNAGNF